MGTNPPPRPVMRGLGCSRYSWCVRETATRARDGSAARLHHGVPSTVHAGDDTASAALIATDDTGTTYVQLETTDAGCDVAVTVWLTPDEAGTLAAMLSLTAT